MSTEETIEAVILALDLYRLSLAKQITKPDTSKYDSIVEHGTLLIEGIQEVCKLMNDGNYRTRGNG